MSTRRRSIYLRLLRWYPARWRRAHREVMLDTLEENADALGRARPTAGEAWSLCAHGLAERATPAAILAGSGAALILSLTPWVVLMSGASDEGAGGLALRTASQFLGALLVCLSGGALLLRAGGVRAETALMASVTAVLAWTLGGLASASWSVGFNEADAGVARSWFGDATWVFLVGAVVLGASALMLVLFELVRVRHLRMLFAGAVALPGAVTLGVCAAVPAGMTAGAVAVLIAAAIQIPVPRGLPPRVRHASRPLTTVKRRQLGGVTSAAAVLGLGCVAFALTGSSWVPAVGDSTQAMRVGIVAGALVAIITVAAGAYALAHRMGRAAVPPVTAVIASLLAVALSYALPMDHPLSWPLILLAAVLSGLAGGLFLAPLLPRPLWIRAVLVTAISLAASASIGIVFVVTAAFFAPLLAVAASVVLLRHPRRSSVLPAT